jgi:uncharacterized protein (TIGR04255 family)
VRNEFPKCQEQIPLSPVIEQFDDAAEEPRSFVPFPTMPRVWFVSDDETRLLQVQRDRFLSNWKKSKTDDVYPRYPQVIEVFRRTFGLFRSFLEELNLGTPEPLQYELSYVNHIPPGEGWSSYADIGHLLPDFVWRNSPSRFLPPPDFNDLHIATPMPERVGRLHIRAQRALLRADRKPITLLDLTARGMPSNRSPEAMAEWFDLAHEWIVRGFTDITGEEVQRDHWRRKA